MVNAEGIHCFGRKEMYQACQMDGLSDQIPLIPFSLEGKRRGLHPSNLRRLLLTVSCGDLADVFGMSHE